MLHDEKQSVCLYSHGKKLRDQCTFDFNKHFYMYGGHFFAVYGKFKQKKENLRSHPTEMWKTENAKTSESSSKIIF